MKTEQPEVAVKIPEIRLRLEDVAYLRSLTAPDGVQCHVPENKLARLRLLGLIEDKEVPQTEKEMERLQSQLDKLVALARRVLDEKKWEALPRSYDFRRIESDMEPRRKTILTEAGMALLKQGSVTVKMQKRGCA